MVILLEIGLTLDCFKQYGHFINTNSTKRKDKVLNKRKYLQMVYDDKRLISKMQLQLKQLSIKKTNNPIKNCRRPEYIQTFSQRRHTNDQEVHETMLIINYQENTNQTTMSYHLTSVTMVISKRPQINVGEDMEKREPQYTIDGNVN